MSEKYCRNYDERYLKIRIISHTGDKVNLKLPIDFVKKMVKNNTIDFFNDKDDVVDSEKLLHLLIRAFDYKLVGEVAYLERNNGDIIRMMID